jgi:hypothetical protein
MKWYVFIYKKLRIKNGVWDLKWTTLVGSDEKVEKVQKIKTGLFCLTYAYVFPPLPFLSNKKRVWLQIFYGYIHLHHTQD